MAKPDNWDQFTEDAKDAYARDLFESRRGRYLIVQALEEAIQVLRKRPNPEASNIEDMEILFGYLSP